VIVVGYHKLGDLTKWYNSQSHKVQLVQENGSRASVPTVLQNFEQTEALKSLTCGFQEDSDMNSVNRWQGGMR
jgi:hypothetical protein